MMKKYQQGGQVKNRRRAAPSYEEDMTPPRGMRNFRSNAVPTDERPSAPSYEEDMTPPRGMRNFRSNAVPSNERPPARRMKTGGKVMAKAPVKKKAGGMIGKGCK
jgi:hypothetical protein